MLNKCGNFTPVYGIMSVKASLCSIENPHVNATCDSTSWAVEYQSLPLYVLEGGRWGLEVPVFLGQYLLDEPVPVEVVSTKKSAMTRRVWREGETVCIYLLYYDDSYVKIGVSAIQNVVVRMYQQAPLLGAVAAVITLKRNFESEAIEREIVAGLSEKRLHTRWPGIEKVIKIWSRPRELFCEDIDEVFGGLCRAVWDYACEKIGEPIHPPGRYWFTPGNGEVPPAKARVVKGSKIRLRALPNGLFEVISSQSTLDGGYARYATAYRALDKWMFRVVKDE